MEKSRNKIYELMKKGSRAQELGHYKVALKYYNEALNINLNLK